MLSIIKTVFFGGIILAGVGYLLPDRLSVGGAFIIGFFVGGAIFVVMKNEANQSYVKLLPLLLIVLLASTWASLCLIGACSIFLKFLICSANKIKALVFIGYTSPMLLTIVLWFQQFFVKR